MAVIEPPVVNRAWIESLRARIDRLGEKGAFLVVAGPLLAVYLLTATWSYPLINDAATNSVAAWSMGTEHSVYLEGYEPIQDYYGWYGWFVPAGDSVASKYPPGAALLATPFYAIWPQEAEIATFEPEDIPEEWRLADQRSLTIPFVPIGPGALTAALTTAFAMGFLAVGLMRLGGTSWAAVAGAYLGGLGTGAWPVAADQLWQHGPAMMWIAFAMVLSDTSLLGSGLAYGAAILTRPPLAIIAAGTGLMRSLRARSWRPALMVGLGALAGLALFLAYNWRVFGEPSISAGYGDGFQEKFFSISGIGLYLRTLFDAIFSSEVGIFIWSPFLLVLLPGLRAGWRASPSWAQGSAIGAVVYLLVQFKANRATGGLFLGYRYPLEALMAVAPILFFSYRERIANRPVLKRAFVLAGVTAVTVNGLAAVGIGVLPA
jgi:hypothetical protein